MEQAFPQSSRHQPWAEIAIGLALVALAAAASLWGQQAIVAGLCAAIGLTLWRRTAMRNWRSPIIVFDFLAFAIYAYQRNDSLSFWQLVGPWADVWRVNAHGAALAYCTYLIGTLFALASRHRALRIVEAVALILTPLMFNAVVVLGADWHMAEIAKLFPPFANIAFPTQVCIGRTLTLFLLAELGLALLSLMELNRLQRDARIHVLLFVSAAIGALTPLIANAAQAVAAPVVLIFVGAVAAALAQAGLWAVVYIATGLLLDAFAGRPASFLAVSGHWKTGFVKGAIYGGMFMAVVLVGASLLEIPGAVDTLKSHVWLAGALGRRARLPLRPDPHRQRRRHAAVLWPPRRRLPRSFGVFARPCGRARRRLRLSDKPRRGGRRRSASSSPLSLALSPTPASTRSSITSASFPANEPRCRPGANTRSARRSAAWSPARSAGTSTPRNCKSS